MELKEKFPSSLSSWVRYSNYEIQNVFGGRRIVPANRAKATVYNPLDHAIEILLEVLNLGKSMSGSIEEAERNLLLFTRKYGALGIFTDILLNEDFLRYPGAQIFVARNPFIKADVYDQEDYFAQFFSVDFPQEQVKSMEEATGRGEIYDSVFSPEYGEYTHWLATYFVETYEYFKACAGYYDAEFAQNHIEIVNRDTSKQLQYVVTAEAKPTLQWIFPSMKSVVDLALAECVTMEEIPLKTCKHCGKIYYNENNRSEFCSPRCRNQFNVYKSRKK